MRRPKLSGREAAVMKCLDGATSKPGLEIRERTQIELEDLVDVINALLEAGFIEAHPPVDQVTADAFDKTSFEINQGYSHLI